MQALHCIQDACSRVYKKPHAVGSENARPKKICISMHMSHTRIDEEQQTHVIVIAR